MKSAFITEPFDEEQKYGDYVSILFYDTWKIKWSQTNRRTPEEYDKKFEQPFIKFCNELTKELKPMGLKLDTSGDEENGFIHVERI